jgi:hypothetical protein
MEKLWIDGEEGRYALQDVAAMPELRGVILGISAKHMAPLQARILEMNMLDPAKDRQMLICKAELDGARSMLNCILQAIENAHKDKRS